MENEQTKIVKGASDNILNSYSAGDIDHPEWFIYEYEHHRKVLVSINHENGHVEFLRAL